jgi:alginate O-acetyltransferase complex protein AlgI
MAIGIGRVFGYKLPTNFRAPYSATSFREFWHHWHITLSQWLRDYLYIGALGGNRKGPVRTQVNIMLTMLLGGLWHGANWTFVLWGWLGLEDAQRRSLWICAGWLCVVQGVVLLAWVLFRSPDFSVAAQFLHRMGDLRSLTRLSTIDAHAWLLTIPVLAYHAGWRLMERWEQEEPAIAGAVSMLLLLAGIMMIDQPVTFIYFKF